MKELKKNSENVFPTPGSQAKHSDNDSVILTPRLTGKKRGHLNRYLRMSMNERIQHFILLVSFFILVVTGFALKFPDALWVVWIRKLFGDNTFELRGLVHRIVAVMTVTVAVYHIFYISLSTRGKNLRTDIRMKKQDLLDVLGSFRFYFGKSNEPPRFGRFSYIEKSEYWAVVWGTVIMGITGTVLWFENTFFPVISNTGMDIATAIHYYEAILAALAILVWHFYFVIYNPDVYPMNRAWLTGYLTYEQMKKEHPLELEQIEKNSPDSPDLSNQVVPEIEQQSEKDVT